MDDMHPFVIYWKQITEHLRCIRLLFIARDSVYDKWFQFPMHKVNNNLCYILIIREKKRVFYMLDLFLEEKKISKSLCAALSLA